MPIEPRERYINPYTDFGFKKLFGTEMNKDLLISFLNAFFEGERAEIEDLQYLNAEHLGDGYGDRRAVFDVYCKSKDGSHFIVEMQKAEPTYFKDRSIYYSTFAIREQAPKGEWDYRLDKIYTVSLINFELSRDDSMPNRVCRTIKLMDTETHTVFYDKLAYIYIELPRFRKSEDELVTFFDKWMYALCNLARLMDRPKALQEKIFTRLFNQAEIAQLSEAERHQYEESRKDFWDYYSTMKTSHDKGVAEGLEKGRAEGLEKGLEKGRKAEKLANARKMKSKGFSTEDIADITGLSPSEIEQL